MNYGPYAKGLPFQVGYAAQWQALERDPPTSSKARRASIKRGKRPTPRNGSLMGMPASAVGFARGRAFRRLDRLLRPARDAGLLRMHRMGGAPALVHRQGRSLRRVVLCDESVAGGRKTSAAFSRDLSV